MQTTHAYQIETGTDVHGSDGEKIGDVAGVGPNYFIIEKGFLFTTDIYVPMSAVSDVSDDRVTLSMTKAQVEDEDWSHEPAFEADESRDMSAGTIDADSDREVLERREERLVVDKDVDKAGEVRVGKNVVEDRQAVDVPVTREEVDIQRRSVDRPASGDSLTDESIDVPVYEERVQTGKDTRVVEELEVGKTATTDTERVEDTVRREEFEIEADAGTNRDASRKGDI